MQSPTLKIERSLWRRGYSFIAGIDEAGRGAWAGPVSAAAVILPRHSGLLNELKGVRDSKLMTARQREIWAVQIKNIAVTWAVASASPEEIDEMGILPATRLAMCRCVEQLSVSPEHLVIDAVNLPAISLPQTSLIHGDALVLSIAAASVLAKTWRDDWMINASHEFPDYGFERNKGYGTRIHRQSLQKHGLITIHRISYKPCQSFSLDKSRA